MMTAPRNYALIPWRGKDPNRKLVVSQFDCGGFNEAKGMSRTAKRPLKVRMSDGPRLGVGLQSYARLAEILKPR